MLFLVHVSVMPTIEGAVELITVLSSGIFCFTPLAFQISEEKGFSLSLKVFVCLVKAFLVFELPDGLVCREVVLLV